MFHATCKRHGFTSPAPTRKIGRSPDERTSEPLETVLLGSEKLRPSPAVEIALNRKRHLKVRHPDVGAQASVSHNCPAARNWTFESQVKQTAREVLNPDRRSPSERILRPGHRTVPQQHHTRPQFCRL